jgi:tetratricopeptide (TPR) repeat protein
MKELDWRTHIETLHELATPGAAISPSRLRELVGLLNPAEADYPSCTSERRQLVGFLEATVNHPLAVEALRPAAIAEVPFGASYEDLLFWLASLYGDDGQLERAIGTVDEAIAAGYDSPGYARTSVVGWLLALGRDDEAAELAASVVAEDPDNPGLYFNLGQEYAEIGRHDNALDWFTEGVRRALNGPSRFGLEYLVFRREKSLFALGRGYDHLQRRAVGMLAHHERQPPPPGSQARLYEWLLQMGFLKDDREE